MSTTPRPWAANRTNIIPLDEMDAEFPDVIAVCQQSRYLDPDDKYASRIANGKLIVHSVNTISAVKEIWAEYKAMLQEKYPAKDGETWEFTCEHHKKIDDLLNGATT